MPDTLNEVTRDPAVGMSRQALYRFAALALLDPKFGSWEQLDALRNDDVLHEAAALLGSLPEAVADKFALGERPLAELVPQRVLERLPNSRDEFNRQFEDTFGLLVSKACPPYETEYIEGKLTFQRSNSMADIGGFYNAFGMTTSAQNPERPDHIVQELEFMALLIGLSRQADAGDPALREERMDVCHDAQARFLNEHLVWWTPAFAALLGREGAGGFYEAVAVFLAALIAAERSLFGIAPAPIPPSPSELEPPEACDGCQV
jgi:TorA maturation chaperone TorD